MGYDPNLFEHSFTEDGPSIEELIWLMFEAWLNTNEYNSI